MPLGPTNTKTEDSDMPMNPMTMLAMAGAFLDNPLVKRLLCNLAASVTTPTVMGTEVDDWVVKILYGAQAVPPGDRQGAVEKRLGEAQQKYEALGPEEKAAAKELRPISIADAPWNESPTPMGEEL